MTTLLLSSSSGKALFAPQTGGGFVILRPIEDRTGGGAREREPVGSAAAQNSLPEQIAFGAAGSPGLA
jgi:hypothetical protein